MKKAGKMAATLYRRYFGREPEYRYHQTYGAVNVYGPDERWILMAVVHERLHEIGKRFDKEKKKRTLRRTFFRKS